MQRQDVFPLILIVELEPCHARRHISSLLWWTVASSGYPPNPPPIVFATTLERSLRRIMRGTAAVALVRFLLISPRHEPVCSFDDPPA